MDSLLVKSLTDRECDIRLHELRSSLRTLQNVADVVAGGYRFDDELADQKLQLFIKAIKRLKEHSQVLEEFYKSRRES